MEECVTTPGSTAGPALPGPVVTLLALAAGTVVLTGMRAASPVLSPVLLALVIGSAASGLRERLARRLPSWLATTAALLVTFFGVAGFITAVALSLLRFAGALPAYRSELTRLLQEAAHGLATLGVHPEQVDSLLEAAGPERLVGLAVGLLVGVASAMSSLLFVLALLFFLLLDASGVQRRSAGCTPASGGTCWSPPCSA
jgi:AI-2 transport protein TqsA